MARPAFVPAEMPRPATTGSGAIRADEKLNAGGDAEVTTWVVGGEDDGGGAPPPVHDTSRAAVPNGTRALMARNARPARVRARAWSRRERARARERNRREWNDIRPAGYRVGRGLATDHPRGGGGTS